MRRLKDQTECVEPEVGFAEIDVGAVGLKLSGFCFQGFQFALE